MVSPTQQQLHSLSWGFQVLSNESGPDAVPAHTELKPLGFSVPVSRIPSP